MTLRARLLLTMTALVGISLVLTDIGAVVFLRALLTRDLALTLTVEARSVYSEWLHTGRLPLILPAGRVAAIYGPGGQLIATSGGDAPDIPPPPGLSVTRRAIRYMIPLGFGGGILLTTGLQPINGPVERLEEVLLVVTALALLVAALLADRLARQIARPLMTLAQEAVRIRETSDLEAKMPEDLGVREIRDLGQAWNRMLRTLREIFHALEASEHRERTLREITAHDLRTPLTTILGSLELLQRGNLPPAAQMEALTLAHKEARRLADRLEGLWSEERAGAADAVQVARRVAQGHPLSAPDQALFVMAPADEVRRVLQLLLDNAERHNPAGTPIEVSVGEAGPEVFVRVRDEGVGMDEETLAHAFDRFYRGGASGGLGLGLSLAKALVESRGGRIVLESAKGRGTTVTVYWRRAEAAPATAATDGTKS